MRGSGAQEVERHAPGGPTVHRGHERAEVSTHGDVPGETPHESACEGYLTPAGGAQLAADPACGALQRDGSASPGRGHLTVDTLREEVIGRGDRHGESVSAFGSHGTPTREQLGFVGRLRPGADAA